MYVPVIMVGIWDDFNKNQVSLNNNVQLIWLTFCWVHFPVTFMEEIFVTYLIWDAGGIESDDEHVRFKVSKIHIR